MIRQNVEAAGALSHTEFIHNLNKDRTEWKLSEWCAYFDPNPGGKPAMSTDEIAAATLWLTEKGYPIPTDCPKRPGVASFLNRDGGCPAFKPVCLTHPICQMARGMCGLINTGAKCPSCKEMFDPEKLRDPLSKKEFQISGLCQKCQDRVFQEPKDPCEDCDKKGTKFCKEGCPI
jgi:hypothetical protein